MIPAGIFRNITKGGLAGAGRFLGTTTGRTVAGAVAGGLYGAMSDNTSVLGGVLMGAGAGRYLGAGFRKGMSAGRGMGFGASVLDYGKRFGMGVSARARLDYRHLMSNRGVNRVVSSLKGWM